MKKLAWTLAVIVAAGVVLLLLLLPSPPVRLDAQRDPGVHTVAGAFHIHSTRSDGAGDKSEIAAAAARAGLRFVILTDHGDGTRPPDPPEYRNQVLCIDAVEISTDQGHYVALGMPRAPYPLGGAADAVAEDVRRLGGFGIAAHPDSPKADLRWTDLRTPIDGIEWLNADSEWRNETRRALVRAGLAYFFRPGPALATLLDRPATLDRWDRLASSRRIVGLAGADAHGGIGTRAEDGTRSSIPGVPGYEASFRTFSTRAVLQQDLTGNASADARALLEAIRAGQVYTVIDGLATASSGVLDFHFEQGSGALVARARMPAGAAIVLLHDGAEVSRSRGDLSYLVADAHGAYRVEIRIPDAPGDPPVPWVVSNPVFFLPASLPAQMSAPALRDVSTIPPAAWSIEKDPGSSVIVRRSNGVEFQYKLREGSRDSQYVALAAQLTSSAFNAVGLTLGADRPMRVSIQLRRADGARWGRSVYVPAGEAAVTVGISELVPVGGAEPRQIDPTAPTSLLLVIDLTNASPGRSGTLFVRKAALQARD